MKKIIMIVFTLMFLVGCVGVNVSRTPAEAQESEKTAEPKQEESLAPPEPQVEEPPEEIPPIEPEPEDETPPEEPPEEEPEEQQSGPAQMNISSGRFHPEEIFVGVGETVTWTNNYDAPIMISGPKGTFNTKLYGGESYTYTFEKTGKHAIIKLVDPIFFGWVYVE
ncbi:hypothetical protein KY360_04615 [Candidatus Woesearchaeota archaeon]|nr:hypothetical protein [Candidatus Woesearchaeota archaeon]